MPEVAKATTCDSQSRADEAARKIAMGSPGWPAFARKERFRGARVNLFSKPLLPRMRLRNLGHFTH